MENFNQELFEKAKQTKSVEELLTLAKENGVELTEEQARAYHAQVNPTSGELSDDELDNVSGGGCGSKEDNGWPQPGALLRLKYFSFKCDSCQSDRVYVVESCGDWFMSGGYPARAYNVRCANCGKVYRVSLFLEGTAYEVISR